MSRLKTVLLLALTLFLNVFFQNCSKMSFADISARNVAGLQTPVDEFSSETPAEDSLGARPEVDPTPIVETLKSMQPTLAVRGASCLLCHAQINSSMITDFGYGTANYMGGTAHFYNGQTWYNNLAGTWQSSRIKGSVYVPDAKVTAKAMEVLGDEYKDKPVMSIAEFMTIPYKTTWTNYLTAEETEAEMAFNIKPADGNERVIAKSEIIIRAPSVAEIKDLAPELWAENTQMAEVKKLGSEDLVQLQRAGDAEKLYITNNEETALECSKADVVVKGTLLLRNLKVNASGGCRIYVTGSVFIEGPIKYEGGGELQNIQITSASAIIMGLKKSAVVNRMVSDARGVTIEARNFAELAQQVIGEAENIGDLKDASDASPRASIDFNGILLNAPVVHSRYLGNIKGTVIAEVALFAVGNFHFEFDPVFTQVDVLPLISNPLLSAK